MGSPESSVFAPKKKEPSPYEQVVADPGFKEWFKGSAVATSEGEPLVVFHSTLAKSFDGLTFKLNTEADDWNSYGIYFTSDRKASRDYYSSEYENTNDRYDRLLKTANPLEKLAVRKERKEYLERNEPNVKTFSTLLQIRNPLVLANHQELMNLSFSGVTREDLMKKFDGIIVRHDPNFTDQYIVFNPEQARIIPSDLELNKNN